jgi:NTP pyrophosphatase (non-canonical NTP hydrolase)|tara:strand:- start:1569 stop:1871 length:303 start_codon:yes stop_codon:yes gene_type:complete
MNLKVEFQPIRDWADSKGIYDSGDPKTQVIKLLEEVGELSKAILEKDKEGIADAIGDSVIVLTSLAHLCNMTIEQCIEDAYYEIKDRQGEMKNGTFIKNK